MSAIDDFLANNRIYAARFGRDRPPPAIRAAVVACMDARMDIAAILGLRPGDAHVIRNAGGVVSDDVIRSLMISQCLLGTREIMLIHHTGCAVFNTSREALTSAVCEQTGLSAGVPVEACCALEESLVRSIERLRSSPLIPHKDVIRGFVYELDTGLLQEIV
jgi:carbonic anhydrase